ncbi:hypothetical protein [Kaarinaea lacus]
MTNRIHPTICSPKRCLLNSLLLLLVIVGAQFIVLTHSHDSLHHNADALCKVCISGEHLSHAITGVAAAGLISAIEFFHAGWNIHTYPKLSFTHALARAPPAGF